MGLYPNFKGIPDIFPPHILLHFHAVPRRFGVKMVYKKQSVLSSNHPVARQYALIFSQEIAGLLSFLYASMAG